MLLKHYLEQGTSKSALARRLGISRETIHRWIRAGELDRDLDAMPPRYGPRPAVPTKLDRYKGIIETRLAPSRSCRRCGCWRKFGQPGTPAAIPS
jgi:transposase-like protein